MPRTYFSLFLPCLIGFSLLATGLSGCTREEKKKARSTVRLNFSRSIESLDSRRTNDEVSANLINMTHEGLLRINLKGDPEPAIAERYTISSDGCTYTFYLRKSNWSDGAPLTAHDFAYAIKSALAPDFVTSIKAKYFPIRGAEAAALGKGPFDAVGIYALDDQTLRFELARPTPYFLELVSSWNYFPVRKNMDEKSASWSTDISSHAFNGPFMIESYLPGNRISLVKNPSYWDAHNVALEAIEISELGDSHTELELFEQGDLDWAGQPLSTGLPIESLEPLRKSGKLKTAPTSKTYFYCLNALSPPLHTQKDAPRF
jgi:oligopeptide transport system substrate-binding protein